MGVTDFFVNTLCNNLKYTPTKCQMHLFQSLSSFATSYNECDLMIISGYAGTGKTSSIASFVKTLKSYNYKYILLAPTGRAAKVLSGFTGEKAYTIHKHIYRQKNLKDGFGEFQLDFNKSKDTFFIVDEASLIQCSGQAGNIFGSGDLLDDLISYVRAGVDDKLILIGDKGQLPPIGLERSPALDLDYMKRYGNFVSSDLTTVVRQASDSGILTNATILRHHIEINDLSYPKMITDSFDDVERINGGDLIEKLTEAFDKYSSDDVIVLCRSNKRANRYNAGIRSTVLYREEKLAKGDKLMVVKNCYQFLEDIPEIEFIANGDMAILEKICKYEERYGLNFAEATLSFPDYNNIEITAKVILDTLSSETASLSQDEQKSLYEGVYADYEDTISVKKRRQQVREDLYFNALQIKYGHAITCHKSQGGQWKCVFIDNPFWQEPTLDDLKWLYTAITRGVEKIYFVNFGDKYFRNDKKISW